MYQFSHIACVSLDRRSDRWSQFLDRLPTDWPFKPIEKYAAINGRACPAPSWWKAGNGAWGCYRSHLNILEKCLNENIDSCLFLEDDAVCGPNFATRVERFLDELPTDWQMIYLGGQHLSPHQHPPVRISENVYVPYNVNRTHAFAIRGRQMMQQLYRHLNEATQWQEAHHIDHHLGQFHKRRTSPIYCPSQWLIGQDENESDICGKMCALRFFPDAIDYESDETYVIINGQSKPHVTRIISCLRQLGIQVFHSLDESKDSRKVNLKSKLSNTPDGSDWSGGLPCRLMEWIHNVTASGRRKSSVTAIHEPQLSAFEETLQSAGAKRFKVIDVSTGASCNPSPAMATLRITHRELDQSLPDCKQRIARFLGRKFAQL